MEEMQAAARDHVNDTRMRDHVDVMHPHFGSMPPDLQDIQQGVLAGTGGGIHASLGTNLTIQRVTLRGNSAFASGGGLYAESHCRVEADTLVVANCSAQLSGGGTATFQVRAGDDFVLSR
eukprot:1195525-Prorocentrum_minimum.AAC.1